MATYIGSKVQEYGEGVEGKFVDRVRERVMQRWRESMGRGRMENERESCKTPFCLLYLEQEGRGGMVLAVRRRGKDEWSGVSCKEGRRGGVV